ncbi:MAG: DUF4922 domain-containing protein [Nitrospirota bacterium]|nr:DUF4922 domain-containing protein [Nitrospirota bacterium]
MEIQKGRLWQQVVRVTEHALQTGALIPVPTEYEFIGDSGIRFFVRILSALQRKDEARKQQEKASTESGKQINPFLPYEKELFVSHISETHAAILNKFNVLEHHLLIVTRHFEDQEMLLTLEDFGALWSCMVEYPGLGFYNGGEAAGASQRHKHLQMVPLPIASVGPEIPIEPLLSKAVFEGGFGTVPAFPFLHVFTRFDPEIVESSSAAEKSFDLYGEMLQRAGMTAPVREGLQRQSRPYCLLVTRKWMLLVPRSREFFESISINSLGFAGALLVRNEEQLALVKKCGPMAVLREVALPA